MPRLTALTLVLLLAACASSHRTVSVMYAGSLATPMEGPISQALAKRGITFEGEGRGSQEIANLILAGLRKPDVVIVVDPRVLARLERAGLVAQSWSLGTASLGIAWAGSRPFPGFSRLSGRIARTDPRLDPKGRYTIEAMRALLGSAGERRLLGEDENPTQIFPEQDLLVRLESSEADFGFIYSTEARSDLHFIALPGRASMAGTVRYFVGVVKDAAHPAAAHAFAAFVLNGDGKRILEGAGLQP